MKNAWWYLIAAAGAYLVFRKHTPATLYVSRGGTSYYQTDEFNGDQRTSADVSATATGPTTLTAEEILGKEIAWTL